MNYHSALAPPLEAKPITEHVEIGESLAFTHDLRHGLPIVYAACDVFYTDLPWRDGFLVFEARAGAVKAKLEGRPSTLTVSKETPRYEGFLQNVAAIVESVKQPVVLVTGKHALRGLPRPEHLYNTYLNGASAVALVYRTELKSYGNEFEILRELAQRFNCVGDFCCGYGRTGRVFKEAGKRFVMSDFNPACIGRIAQEWRTSERR